MQCGLVHSMPPFYTHFLAGVTGHCDRKWDGCLQDGTCVWLCLWLYPCVCLRYMLCKCFCYRSVWCHLPSDI